MQKREGRTPWCTAFNPAKNIGWSALKRLKSVDDQEDHEGDEQASHDDKQVNEVKLFPHKAICMGSLFLVEGKSGHKAENKSVYHYQEHDKTEPGKDFKKPPHKKILQSPEGFQIDLLNE